MARSASFLSILVLGGVVSGSISRGDDAHMYLTEKDGRKELKAPLTMREEQVGFAGATGTVFIIEPSGQWKVERFRRVGGGKEELTPLRKGTLTPSQLETLAKALADHGLSELTAKAGREPKANPHSVTIQFGQKTSKLEGLPPRRGPSSLAEHVRKAAPEQEQATKVWDQFAGLIQAVERHCQEPKAP